MNPFAQIQSVIQEESLISDELRIIAGEARGLRSDQRASVMNGALLIEYMLKNYNTVYCALVETQRALAATQDRLREVGAIRAGNAVFPTVSGRIDITYGAAP